MSLGAKILNQCSKPSGWLGRVNLWRMNKTHAGVTAWGLAHISVQPGQTILDIGCGGGVTVARLAARSTPGKVYGIDFSEASVAASKQANHAGIAAGQVEILHGSVSHLPFPDAMFDLVSAVETHYYWPNLVADFQEVLRVLKPGGAFILIAEAYKGGKHDELLQKLENLQGLIPYAHLTIPDHHGLFSKAGFTAIEMFENYDKGWMCGVGRKSE
jgi:SAM-dependent methyltransferase